MAANHRVEAVEFCRSDVIFITDESKKQTLHTRQTSRQLLQR